MRTKELAKHVQDSVEEDLTLHYRVTDTTEFLNRLFPVEKTDLDSILEYMKDKEFYNSETRRWTGFPDLTRQESESTEMKKPKEDALYGPFSQIAEAIRVFAEKRRRSTSEMGASKWVDYHSQSPKTPNSNAAKLRPDVIFALRAVAEQTVSKDSQVRTMF